MFRIVFLFSSLLATTSADAIELQFTQVSGRGQVVDIRNAGDGSDRLFLVEQSGRVWILEDGSVLDTPFLDIRNRVTSGGERGLLSIAFAPDHAASGFFYVWYTDQSGDTVLSRFSVSADPDLADANSEDEILMVPQPFSNHNGGRLLFGMDGYLYLGLGDGGSANDPQGNAQNLNTLLGKIIRIDVDPEHQTYAIPADNPYVGVPNADNEIWASGLRNPWRMSFDRATGDLYIADVGQGTTEEVNFQPFGSAGGENYGWNVMEGSQCFQGQNCNLPGLTLPVAEYSHSLGCSVTGGEVYRGNAYPDLAGVYLYGDYCSGRIWGLSREGDDWQAIQLATTDFSIVTFGEGEDGSVYVSAQGDGIYLISDGPVVPESVFHINAGLNDAWFNPVTAGQGFFVIVFPLIKKIFLSWFTYEIERPDASIMAQLGEPGHRWLTAFGDYADDEAVLDIEITSGGVFDAPDPMPAQSPDGTITIRFSACNAGTIVYDIPSINRQGVVPIERIALDNVPLCEELAAMGE